MIARRGRQCGVDAYPHRFRHHFSHTWLDRGGPEGDLMELNGWASPQMLTRYGASERSARARRTYDRIMTDTLTPRLCQPPGSPQESHKSASRAAPTRTPRTRRHSAAHPGTPVKMEPKTSPEQAKRRCRRLLAVPIGGGQGQDRTVDLPLFRRSVASDATG
jgi:hypothetical protein